MTCGIPLFAEGEYSIPRADERGRGNEGSLDKNESFNHGNFGLAAALAEEFVITQDDCGAKSIYNPAQGVSPREALASVYDGRTKMPVKISVCVGDEASRVLFSNHPCQLPLCSVPWS
jgi:hypothetical protein